MIHVYSKARDGETYITKNFKVKEFACHDGSDTIKMDDTVVAMAQQLRDHFGQPVYVASGYRTPAYNTSIGGAKNSWHMYGRAIDLDVGSGKTQVDPRIVAMYCDAMGVGGIGLYIYPDGRNWIHIDNGDFNGHWVQYKPNTPQTVQTFLPILKRQFIVYTYKFEVEVAQTLLKAAGCYTGTVDGKFGKGTYDGVMKFQRLNALKSDGIIGPNTWKRLFGL